MTDVGVTTASLSESVADEVRVALARKRMSAAALARELGVSQTYIWRRLEAQTAFDLTDLERIGSILGVTPLELISAATRGLGGTEGPLNRASDEVPRTDDPDRVRHVASRPFTSPRRDRSRPASPIPANRRRPAPARPGEWAMSR